MTIQQGRLSKIMSEQIRMLIVDDDEKMLRLNSEYLSVIGDYQIENARTAESTKKLIMGNEYEIILLDYKLPDGNGIDILTWMAQNGYRIPVIMITGQGDEEIAAQSIQLGASDYLVKGDRYLANLPKLIKQTIDAHQLKLSYEESLERVRYQALLLGNVRDAVVVWDTDGKITYWNQAAEILYKKPASSCIGEPADTLYLNTFTPQIRPPGQHDTSGMYIERQFTSVDGDTVWVSSRVSILRNYENNGALIGFIDVTRDVTERRHLDEQIRASQTQLIQSARMSALGELAAGVAHQINNPLTTIIAESQLAKHNLPVDHVARESIEAVEEAGWITQQAVQKLLDFSRPASTTIESISINQTIKNALNVISDQILSSGTAIKIDLAQKLPPVKGNQQQLEDLWINLLLQARDATIDGDEHTIWVRSINKNSGSVVVEVEDDGQAIPPEKLETIFEPNFIDGSVGRGTGMELSICREIVRQHRGKITASRMGEIGTKIIVFLPQEYKV